jgi:CheY-like chemotaxis protein
MKRALVIDDDANIGAAIRAILASQQIETVLALRAHAGVHELETSRFEVAIVDIFMPGMGGLDTIARIKELAPDLPIVAMTGFRFRDSMDPAMDFLGMARQRGAVACIRKPFIPQQLIDAINAGLAQPPHANRPLVTGAPR